MPSYALGMSIYNSFLFQAHISLLIATDFLELKVEFKESLKLNAFIYILKLIHGSNTIYSNPCINVSFLLELRIRIKGGKLVPYIRYL